MLNLLALLQSDPSPWPAIGASGGPTTIAGILLYLLRQQGIERAAERVAAENRAALQSKASEDRYAALAMDFRKIVTESTQSTDHLTDAVDRLMGVFKESPMEKPRRTRGD